MNVCPVQWGYEDADPIEDIERLFDLGANAYLVKSSNLEELVEMPNASVSWLSFNRFAPLL